MKGRRIAFAGPGVRDAEAARREIVRVRLAEALVRAGALEHGGARELHDLRIACKRLRYALELHRDALPAAVQGAERLLAGLQDLLGELHDCDVLLAHAERIDVTIAARVIGRDRRLLLGRARRLWREAFAERGDLTGLAAYAGFGSPQGPGGSAP
ncbi:MAG TPA: CHAD domain-containing protein [Candidatus Dormibacteraeota bacterium]|nr:CHAD domain-containing protein [Candidatus Dormibacteraeota bacterium]